MSFPGSGAPYSRILSTPDENTKSEELVALESNDAFFPFSLSSNNGLLTGKKCTPNQGQRNELDVSSTLRLSNTRFCVFPFRINHYEVHLLVRSRVITSTLFRIVI